MNDIKLLAEAYDSIITPPETEDITINGKSRRLFKLDVIDTESHKIPVGVYPSLYYGNCLEVEGLKLKTKTGVRCRREFCGGPHPIVVREDGSFWKVYEKHPDREGFIHCKKL